MMKKGFSLAEVLIVLVVVGVIAVISIPTLITNTDKHQYVTALKKFYATGTQAFKKMANDYGCPGDLSCTKVFVSANQGRLSPIAKYFNASQDCGSSGGKCWADSVNDAYDGSGVDINRNTLGYYNFITADGMSVAIGTYKTDCNSDSAGPNTIGPLSKTCAWLYVDVNGLKEPNRYGRDVFAFFIVNGQDPSLYPMGGDEDKWYGPSNSGWGKCSLPKTNNQLDCAARIMKDNWQMNY